MPLIAAAMRPKPGRSRYGPVWPKAEMRTITRPALTRRRSSQPSPQRSIVPGRKFSASTSAPAARRLISAWPSGARRLQVIDFLLRDSTSHQYDSPSRAGVPSRGRSSPRPGCSTLITSAPNSPRSVAQKGAATNVARSSTVRPSRARGTSPTSTLAGGGLQGQQRLLDVRDDLAGGRAVAHHHVLFDGDAEAGDRRRDRRQRQADGPIDALGSELEPYVVHQRVRDRHVHAIERAA